MIPFKTTPEQVINLATIMVEMKAVGVDPAFIAEASELARTDQGVYDLMAMWFDAKHNVTECEEIIADIQKSIDDYGPIQRFGVK